MQAYIAKPQKLHSIPGPALTQLAIIALHTTVQATCLHWLEPSVADAQGMALAEEVSRVQREAEAAASKLESLLRERDAHREHLAQTQQALQEAMQHLEELSDKAQVPFKSPSSGMLHHSITVLK